MAASARVVVALELELEAGATADASVLGKSVADQLSGLYILSDGGRWVIEEVEMASAAVSRSGEHA
jgi:hypothetical protein